MTLNKLPKFLFMTVICFALSKADAATQVRFLSGTKSQSFNTSSQEQIGSSPLGLLALLDVEIMKKTYFSLGTSFELSTETFSTSGFSLYGGLNYYFYGDPKALVSSDHMETSMELYRKHSFYGTLGIFQKEIKLRDPETQNVDDESLGGLLLGFGANYNLSSKMYLNAHLQYLSSGSGTSEEYSSFELYVGVGLRI